VIENGRIEQGVELTVHMGDFTTPGVADLLPPVPVTGNKRATAGMPVMNVPMVRVCPDLDST
jgi:predicted phosphodiesterase